ncbi:MAG: EF-hand protein, partial [Sphingomonadales bacterium]|nr:EF-hand protein [Sphingomonadales bacterium]
MRCIVPPLLLLLTASATVTAPEQAPPAKLQTSTPAPTLSPADAPTAIGNGTYGPDHAGSREPGGFRPGILFISPAGQPFRAAPGDPYPVATWFAQTDTNHDGQLTIGEMRDDATRFFAELDANHDGEIDPDEV